MSGPRALAEQTKPIAQAWVTAAQAALHERGDLLRAALETNFFLSQARHEDAHVTHIEDTLRRIRKVLDLSRHYFADVTDERAREIFAPASVPPAYTIIGDHVYFTPEFREWDEATRSGFGPMCRAAMIVHEAVHIFDRRSGEPEIHVSEWDERFETRTPEQQLHNPSAYASFCAQIHERRLSWPREDRHGAGNRAR